VTLTEFTEARLRKSATHDLTRADYSFRPIGDGQRGHIACWHAITADMKPRPGDYLILRNGRDTTRYQVETIDPCLNVDPPTMWMAGLLFSPRPGAL
jgi:hypothetical protein